MPRSCLALLLLLLAPLAARGQDARIRPELLKQGWPARWIAHPADSRTGFGVYHFRRAFDLAARPDSFVLHVTADNRYRLFLNGVPVSTGPERGDLAHWRYETVDVAPQLRPGRNVLAAVVWNYGGLAPVAQISHGTGFLVQGNGAREAVVNTGAAWKVHRNEAYAPIPIGYQTVDGYYAGPPGERVDAVAYPWGWETPGFADDGWAAARELAQGMPRGMDPYGAINGWMLVPRTLPPMEEAPQRFARLARAGGVPADDGFLRGGRPLTVPPRTKASLLLDQAFLTTAYPELVVSGGRGAKITVTYAEALRDEQGRKGHRDEIEGKRILGYHDEFRPDGGDRRLFRPLWFRTYRFVQLDVETAAEPLELDDLRGVFTAYPLAENARFASSDGSLEDVWRVGWRTARLCAGETYYDCPYYEQLQYVGDTRIQALISLYVSGDDRLMRNAIRHLDDSRIPDGITASRYPSNLPQFIPPFSLYWIAMIHDYWRHRDDPAFVRSFLPGVRGVIDWYERHLDESGMLGPMPWWNFADWAPEYRRGVPPGAEDGRSAVISLELVYALRYAADLAEAFDRPDEAARYRGLAASVGEAVYRLCWDEARGLIAETPEKRLFSQHANVMAVLTDAVPAERQAALMRRVEADTSLIAATYYYRFYVNQALKKAGLAAGYVERLGPWREMLSLGLTTFAENPEPTRSDCHAWSASPNYDFLATVAGIEPAAPGFRRVRIAPHLGPLGWIEARMPHPAGEIRVRLDRAGPEGVRGEITLPPGLDGTFYWNGREIPLSPGSRQVEL